MLKLIRTIEEHDPGTLGHILKQELESGTGAGLPLHKGANEGGYCDASNLEVTILSLDQNNRIIRATIGVFFTEIVANCSCGDEPVEKPAYCEMLLNIDRTTAETDVHVV